VGIDLDVIIFAFNGIIGALLNVLMWSNSIQDLKSFNAIKILLIGSITGYIYWWAHSEYNLPDGLMGIVAGYTSEDFIEWILEKTPWLKKSTNPTTNSESKTSNNPTTNPQPNS